MTIKIVRLFGLPNVGLLNYDRGADIKEPKKRRANCKKKIDSSPRPLFGPAVSKILPARN